MFFLRILLRTPAPGPGGYQFGWLNYKARKLPLWCDAYCFLMRRLWEISEEEARHIGVRFGQCIHWRNK